MARKNQVRETVKIKREFMFNILSLKTKTEKEVCKSEQAAVRALGYTAVSWDNVSGKEQQPWSYIKSWPSLTSKEKAAAETLGYTQKSWDNESGFEVPPASLYKYWSELSSCPGGKISFSLNFIDLFCLFADLSAAEQKDLVV